MRRGGLLERSSRQMEMCTAHKCRGTLQVTAIPERNHPDLKQPGLIFGGPVGHSPTRLLCPWEGFSRRERWSGLPCPPPGDLPGPGIETESPALAGGPFI